MTLHLSPCGPRKEGAIDVVLWGLAASSAALTLWFSLGLVPPGAGAFPGADKASHGVAFFVTTLLLLFAAVWRPGRGTGPLARLAPGLIVAIIFSGLIVELLQATLTARRQADLADWLADVAGVVAATLVLGLVRRVADSYRLSPAPDTDA